MPGCDAAAAWADASADAAFAALAEESGTYRSPATRTLSDAFWRCDFTRGLPRTISKDGVEVTAGALDRIRGFLSREFPTLTEEGLAAAPLDPQLAHTKRWY